jgi:phospholipid transport system substrate-binding protein
MKTLLISLMLALGLSTVAAAAPVAPDIAVKDTTEKMRDLIRANHDAYKADKNKFYAVVDEVLLPRFDVNTITKLVLGRNGKTATPEQKARFSKAFKNSLIRNYADALLDNYNSVEAKFQPVRMAADATDVTVKSELTYKDSPPIQVSFAMNLVDGDWKVYDVIISNLSLISSFRGQFNEEIKKNGLDGLIAKLESGDFVKKAANDKATAAGK